MRTILTTRPRPRAADDEDELGRRRTGRRVLFVADRRSLVVVVLAAGAAIGLRESHFIGANETTGRVEIYQGVPIDLFGGIKLYHAVYASPVT